jgi:3-hydroxyacyl-CoA dehydrogenase
VDGKPVPSPHVAQIIAEERSRAGHPQQVFDSADIMARILDVMQREGRAILAEGIADAPGDIDVVMVNGYGFPRHRGGPMFMDPLTPDSSK